MLKPQQLDTQEAIEEGYRQPKDSLAYRLSEIADEYLREAEEIQRREEDLLEEIANLETELDECCE